MSYRKAPTIKYRVVRSYLPAMKRTTWLDRGIRGMFKFICMYLSLCIYICLSACLSMYLSIYISI